MVRTGGNGLLQGWSCNQRKGCVSCFSSFRTLISSLIPLGCRTSEISNPSGGRMGSRAYLSERSAFTCYAVQRVSPGSVNPRTKCSLGLRTHYTTHLEFITFKGHLESGVCDKLGINMPIWYSLCLETVRVAMSVNTWVQLLTGPRDIISRQMVNSHRPLFMSLTLLTTAMSVCVRGVGELCPVSASFLKHSPDFYLGKFCAVALTIGYPWSPWKPEGYSPHEISMKQTGPACLWMRNEVPVALKALVFQPHHDTHTPFMPSHPYLPSNSKYQMEVKIY